MANAFLLAPLPFASVSVAGAVVSGSGAYLMNDYAGMNCTVVCDLPGNVGAIVTDLGREVVIDTVMVFGLGLIPTNATAQVVYRTGANPEVWQEAGRGDAYAGSIQRTGGGVLLLTFPAVTARYVNVNVEATAPGQSFVAARIVVGKRFQPATGFEYGAQFGVRDLGALDVNARGVLLRHRGKKLRTVSLNFPSLTKQEAESTAQKLLEQVGNTECIALCTDPTPDPERQNRCYFGPLVGDLTRTWASARGHEVRVNLLGLL